MDFRFSEEEEAFRHEIRAFIRENLTPEIRRQTHVGHAAGPAARAFVRKLAEKGWLTRSWPVEWGGEGKHPINLFILGDELRYAYAPGLGNGIAQIGPTLLRHGTRFQKEFFLPKIRNAEIDFGLGYSEPESGSDLASLQLRAVRDGDDYVMNGQKRFTTSAHYANYMWLAGRTDPNVPKHRGISLFLVDMTLPGISHRPLWCMGGEQTNEVYYDNVRVPAEFRVGEENRGWYIISESLDYERSYQMPPGPIRRQFDELLTWARTAERDGRPVRENPYVRQTLAHLAIETEVATMHSLRVVDAALHERVPNLEGAMNKLWGSHLQQRFGHTGVELMGLYGQLLPGSPYVESDGFFSHLVMDSVVRTIAGGTSEVQKNIIAKRGLGLPG
jgi:alkylation response protein AidB-like acyl-CoA dehydrogenase